MKVSTLRAILATLPADAELQAYEGEDNGVNVNAGDRHGFISLSADTADAVQHDLASFGVPS